jgi:serine protease Do
VSVKLQLLRVVRNSSLFGILLMFATVASAQTPPQELVSHVKRAVVVITTHNAKGTALQQGTGFFITPERLVTNLHLVRSATDIRIQTFNGSTASVKSIVVTDEKSDLAILQLNSPCPGTTTLQVDELHAPEGEKVMVVSNPRGSLWKVTVGQVGATWNFEHQGTRMQITASLKPGSSGGPVVNLQGHVVGVAAMHVEGAEDLDFAIPAERLNALRPRN